MMTREGGHHEHRGAPFEHGGDYGVVAAARKTQQTTERLPGDHLLEHPHARRAYVDSLDTEFWLGVVFAQPVHELEACCDPPGARQGGEQAVLGREQLGTCARELRSRSKKGTAEFMEIVEHGGRRTCVRRARGYPSSPSSAGGL